MNIFLRSLLSNKNSEDGVKENRAEDSNKELKQNVRPQSVKHQTDKAYPVYLLECRYPTLTVSLHI